MRTRNWTAPIRSARTDPTSSMFSRHAGLWVLAMVLASLEPRPQARDSYCLHCFGAWLGQGIPEQGGMRCGDDDERRGRLRLVAYRAFFYLGRMNATWVASCELCGRTLEWITLG